MSITQLNVPSKDSVILSVAIRPAIAAGIWTIRNIMQIIHAETRQRKDFGTQFCFVKTASTKSAINPKAAIATKGRFLLIGATVQIGITVNIIARNQNRITHLLRTKINSTAKIRTTNLILKHQSHIRAELFSERNSSGDWLVSWPMRIIGTL